MNSKIGNEKNNYRVGGLIATTPVDLVCRRTFFTQRVTVGV